MNKSTKFLKGIFSEMIPEKYIYSFFSMDENLAIEKTEIIEKLLVQYELKYNLIKDDINDLIKLEELILQMRCEKLIEHDIKLSIVKNHIYARTIFYRLNKNINDIRIIVGKTKENGSDIKKLLTDKVFMDNAKQMMQSVIKKEILNTFKKQKSEIF